MGHAIYFRNTTKARLKPLLENIKAYLQKYVNSQSRVYFVPYCHELFDPKDRHDFDMLLNGLEDLKIYLSKFFLGNTPIVDVCRNLSNGKYDKKYSYEFSKRLFVANGSVRDSNGIVDWSAERDKFILSSKGREDNQPNSDITVFLLSDRSVQSKENYFPGDKQYIVCYVQIFFNHSPLIVFNESKPGWISPVTLPQTLSAAMINMARPWFSVSGDENEPAGELRICDPFLGSGTTLLDTVKLPQKINFVGCDRNPLSSDLVKDNVKFFSMTSKEISTLSKEIGPFVRTRRPKRLPEVPIPAVDRDMCESSATFEDLYMWAVQVITREMPRNREFSAQREAFDHKFSEDVLSVWKNEEEYFRQRMVFYVCWRAVCSNIVSLLEGYSVNREAFIIEWRSVVEKLNDFARLRIFDDHNKNKFLFLDKDRLCVQTGQFSKEVVVQFKRFLSVVGSIAYFRNGACRERCSGDGDMNIELHEDKAEKLLANYYNHFDLIVADPPYGFNTDIESASELATLYKATIDGCVKAIKNDGQLIMCVPEQSRTGQSIPFFTTRKMVVRQVLIAAEENGKQVIQESRAKPFPEDCFLAPYYWRSEKSLTRSILHFRFRPLCCVAANGI